MKLYMVQLVLDEEVDEVFSAMKTEETTHKASPKVRAVTYHTASIRDHMTLQKYCSCLSYCEGWTAKYKGALFDTLQMFQDC